MNNKRLDINQKHTGTGDNVVNVFSSELLLTAEWLKNQAKKAIINLGNRYTPTLNFELEQAQIFDGLGKTRFFQNQYTEKFDTLLTKGNQVLEGNSSISKEDIKNNINNLYSQFHLTNFDDISKLPVSEFNKIISILKENINTIRMHLEAFSRKKDHVRDYELTNSREFAFELFDFERFINSTTCALFNNPILVLTGEAGVGKSHMLGDIVSKRIELNYESIFLLGQHFVTSESPWNQILKILQISSNSNDFLGKLNKRAKETKKRIIIFIDAINEGKGIYFWADHIHGFINEIKEYEWLGLVLSVRTSYKNLIFPDNNSNYTEYKLHGFKDTEYEASKLFFNTYGIELPSIPLLHPEFQNPLFLKLFCEGMKKSSLTRIPDGLQGITAIIDFFINGVNTSLSRPNKVHYQQNINLVKKSINALIKYKADNQLNYIPYETGYKIITSTISPFHDKKDFVEDLISEGVLSKNIFWKDLHDYEEGIYLAYERFENHLTAQYLLEICSDLDNEFSDTGCLYKYIKDEKAIYSNKGIIDAFSIQIPEETNRELFEYIPKYKNSYPIMESFTESLLWRKVSTIGPHLNDYINKYVLSNKNTYNLFWEIILSVTSNPKHYFNAMKLHEILNKCSLPDRDASWTQDLKDKYTYPSSVKRLIDWAWHVDDDKIHISNESIKLSCIALAWFHTSTNRKLRDCSTKALISLLQERISLLIDILQLFHDVNDPYILERLYAVAYGCSIRTTDKEKLINLSQYVYNSIFDKDEVYPHILLRDYARGIIEYTLHLGYNLMINVIKIRPPYKSRFELKEVDTSPYKQDYITHSMATNDGGWYGDFGRYIFQSALDDFDVNTHQLRDMAIELIFQKYHYDFEKHGDFDKTIGTGRARSTTPNERIGKKYQWLAFHEILARVSDNYKKYDFLHKEEEPYTGPWEPYLRDIDPTFLFNDENKSNSLIWWTKNDFCNWSLADDDWLYHEEDLPSPLEIIVRKDSNNEDWLVLGGHPSWREPKELGESDWMSSRKLLWYNISSYLVKKEDYDKLRMAINNGHVAFPQNSSRYQVFSREYYWSPAYNFFANDYHNGKEWKDVYDSSRTYIAEAIITTEDHLWESEYDNSKTKAINYLKPCKNIFYGMKLEYNKNDGEYTNSGKLIFFAPNLSYDTPLYALIKKDEIIKYLFKADLKIIWVVRGEKQIIGNANGNRKWMEIIGYYYTENDDIVGDFKINKRNS